MVKILINIRIYLNINKQTNFKYDFWAKVKALMEHHMSIALSPYRVCMEHCASIVLSPSRKHVLLEELVGVLAPVCIIMHQQANLEKKMVSSIEKLFKRNTSV